MDELNRDIRVVGADEIGTTKSDADEPKPDIIQFVPGDEFGTTESAALELSRTYDGYKYFLEPCDTYAALEALAEFHVNAAWGPTVTELPHPDYQHSMLVFYDNGTPLAMCLCRLIEFPSFGRENVPPGFIPDEERSVYHMFIELSAASPKNRGHGTKFFLNGILPLFEELTKKKGRKGWIFGNLDTDQVKGVTTHMFHRTKNFYAKLGGTVLHDNPRWERFLDLECRFKRDGSELRMVYIAGLENLFKILQVLLSRALSLSGDKELHIEVGGDSLLRVKCLNRTTYMRISEDYLYFQDAPLTEEEILLRLDQWMETFTSAEELLITTAIDLSN